MKRVLIAIMCLTLVACAGVGIKLADNAGSVLQTAGISSVGYLIIKNNPQFRDPIVDWYKMFNQVDELGSIKLMFQNGVAKLTQAVSHDPFLTMQIQSAMSMLEISVDGPETEFDISKYRRVVDAFLLGVLSVPINL